MKKILIGVGIVLVVLLGGFLSQNWLTEQAEKVDKMIHPDYEKIDEARGILDKVLEHIAESSPELAFVDGQLVDAELGLPVFEVVPVSEIEHFDEKDIVDGYVVHPVVANNNPKLLMVVQATDKEATVRVKDAMGKMKSDQYEDFAKANMWIRHLIDENATERQGNFLIYATWDDAKELVKVFQRHVQ